VEFKKACAFRAEELLFAAEGTEFFFEIFLCSGKVFELEAEASLEVALFGEERLSFLLNLFTKPLLLGFDVLPELFTLFLKFFRLSLEFLEERFVGALPIFVPGMEPGGFIGEGLAEEFRKALFFCAKFGLCKSCAFGVFVAIAFVLDAESIAFSVESSAFLSEFLAFFIEFCADRLLEDDSFFGEESLCGSEFGLLSLEEFFLLCESPGSLLEFGGEIALFSAGERYFGSKLAGAGFEGCAFGFELFDVGLEISASLIEFGESELQGFGGSGGLQQNSECVRFDGIRMICRENDGRRCGRTVRRGVLSRRLRQRHILRGVL
jgi:hypothetical protein